MLAPIEFGPADRAGAHNDHTAVAASMCANAGGVRIGGDGCAAKGMCLGPRRGQIGRFARTCKRQARGDSREVLRRQAGLIKAVPGGLTNRRKTVFQPKPDIGRTRHSLAQRSP